MTSLITIALGIVSCILCLRLRRRTLSDSTFYSQHHFSNPTLDNQYNKHRHFQLPQKMSFIALFCSSKLNRIHHTKCFFFFTFSLDFRKGFAGFRLFFLENKNNLTIFFGVLLLVITINVNRLHYWCVLSTQKDAVISHYLNHITMIMHSYSEEHARANTLCLLLIFIRIVYANIASSWFSLFSTVEIDGA